MTARTEQARADHTRAGGPRTDNSVQLDGGTFTMGSDVHYPEEAPAHPVRVDGFRIDRFAVTNAQFETFVEATGYETVAERPLDPALYRGAPEENLAPGSMVFTPTPGPVDLRHLSQWWAWVPGASWRRPEGPGSGIDDRGDHPVVHVAHDDAAAYAEWAGAELPTEAQWEYAARGGVEGAAFTWGDEARPTGRVLANTWDGPDFPWRSTGESGWLRTAPVGSFAPNGYGLYDMAGNVWEWTGDWWADRHPDAAPEPCCAPVNPRGGDAYSSRDPRQPQFAVPRKVIKGGSFLCADNYCLRYRPAARRPQPIDTGMSHVGFRCVRNDTALAAAPPAELPSVRPLGMAS
jgi:sulfatase modifying factor 1